MSYIAANDNQIKSAMEGYMKDRQQFQLYTNAVAAFPVSLNLENLVVKT